MPSRIPRPGGAAAPLQALNENTLAATRKRKDASPAKAPPSKRSAAAEAAPPPAVLPDAPAAPPEELEAWMAVSEETGWAPEDCLSHKITFPKRCDAGKKVETLAGHVKRLRAVGWHLFDERARGDAALADAQAAAETQRAAAAATAAAAAEAAQLAAAEAEGLKQAAEAAKSEASRRSAELEAVREELASTKSALADAEAAHAKVTADLAAQEAAAAALQAKLEAAESAAADSQKYNAQLQEFNSKAMADLSAATEAAARLQEEKAELAEEAAALRGRLAALGDALSALQAASASGESVRQAAAEEAARLRADLAAACAERGSLAADVTRLREENDAQRRDLERFRAATGKDLAALEAEKETSAALAGRTQAQAATVAALQDQVAMLQAQRDAAEARADGNTDAVRTLTARVAELEALLSSAEERIREGEATRRRLHNTILELKGNVRVFARVRPPTSAEAAAGAAPALEAPAAGELAGRGLEITQAGTGGPGSKGPQRHTFTFDRVFGPAASQAEVFEEVSALVQSALDGYAVTVFAYGQTNAGKTHTMLGVPGPDGEGIIPRAVRQVFATAESLKEQGWRYEMRAAMLEIYNEELRDLLGKGPPAGKKLAISHEPGAALPTVAHLEWVDVNDEGRVGSLLQRAMAQRAVGATASNDVSSRSHMVFLLGIEGTNDTTGQKSRGAINLVDLAGSERLGKSGASGERLKETQAINKSLSALGDVISALGSRESHVPYRNSKLTYLLQGSLSGAGKALMLCAVSPAVENAAESLCTLRFAAKVNATEIGTARRNVSAAK